MKKENNEPKMPFELFGIECGSGWNRLVYPILGEVELYNKTHENKATITQIKEKYGTLNVYGFFPDHIQKMVDKAENASEYICETCGATKNIGATVGWVKTICHDCAVKSGKESIWKKRKSRLYRRYINFKYSFSYRKRRDIKNFFSKLKTFFD